jgi:hypothetical protein
MCLLFFLRNIEERNGPGQDKGPRAADAIGWTLDVLTERPVTTGGTLAGRCSLLRGVSVAATSVLNISGPRADFPPVCCAGGDDEEQEGGGRGRGGGGGGVALDEELLAEVRAQVEFYLGDRNLPQDSYFLPLTQAHPEGYVPLAYHRRHRRNRSGNLNWLRFTILRSAPLNSVPEQVHRLLPSHAGHDLVGPRDRHRLPWLLAAARVGRRQRRAPCSTAAARGG